MHKFLNVYFKYFILAALLYQPLFGNLDTLPIRIWDEARVAINAYEMMHDKDLIVTHFQGAPDMWNTKPPLLVWIQAGFMKMMGVGELAVRLPSAIAAFFTCLVLLVLSVRYLKSFWFGFIAVIVLITSSGYIEMHSVRTGDYDAMLTLFTTVSCFFFFVYCEKREKLYLYLFFGSLALGVLTKSITGLLFLPGLAIYAFVEKQVHSLVRNRHFYYGLIGFFVIVAGYYLWRELRNPGYLAAVQANELGGRFLNVIEYHKEGFWYYYNNIIDTRLHEWYLLVPCGLLTGLFIRDQRIRKIVLFSVIMAITFFLVISISKTKLTWYDIPLYPFLAIIIASFIYFIFDFLRNYGWLNEKLRYNVIPFIFLFLMIIAPYQMIIGKTYKPKDDPASAYFYETGYYLKDAIKGKHNVNNQFLLYDGYNLQNMFYIYMLNGKGVKIDFKDYRHLSPGDLVFAQQDIVKNYLKDHYTYEKLSVVNNVITYRINDRKNQ